MNKQADLLLKVLGYLAGKSPGFVTATGDAQIAASGAESELVDRSVLLDPRPLPPRNRVLLDPRPWPPRSRVLAGLREVAVSSPEATKASAFEIGMSSANHLVQLAWMAESLGVDSSQVIHKLDDWCGTGKQLVLPPSIPPVGNPGPDWIINYQLGMLTEFAAVSVRKGCDLATIGRAVDILTNAIEAALS